MKTNPLAWLPLLILSFPIQGQTPTLMATPSAAGSNSFDIKALSLPVIKQDPGNKWNPVYWDFWVFGDGEYAPTHLRPYWSKFPAPSKKGSPLPPAPAAAHSFPGSAPASYTTYCFLNPRKGDNPFPGYYPSTSISFMGTGGTYSRQKLLNNGRKIYLEHSLGYYRYKGEKSAFAISYLPYAYNEAGRVLLFFNSEVDATKKAGPKNIFNCASTPLIPNYGASTTPVCTVKNVKSFDSACGTTFQKEFQDVFQWDFSDAYIKAAQTSSIGIQPGDELRVFPVFTTLSEPNNTHPAYALAVITTPSPISGGYDLATATRVRGILSGAVSPLPASITDPIHLNGIGNVVDVDTIYLKSGEPTDPNHLVIKEICPCPDNKNQYMLTFLLTYKNVGTAPATKAVIQLNTLHPDFKFCKILDVQRYNDSYKLDAAGILTVTMGDETDTGKEKRLEPQQTVEVTFTMTASGETMNASTLRTILINNFVAGGNIYFNEDNKNREYFINEKIYANDSIPCVSLSGDNCCSKPTPPIWQLLLLGFALLFTGWLIRKIFLKK